MSLEHGEVVGYRPYVSDRCLDFAGEITYATTSAPTNWIISKVQTYLVFGFAAGLLLVALVVVVASRYDVSVHARVTTTTAVPLGNLGLVSERNEYDDLVYDRAPEVSPEREEYEPLTVYLSDPAYNGPPSPPGRRMVLRTRL